MLSTLDNCHLIHQGWMRAHNYLNETSKLRGKPINITTEEELNRIAEIFDISSKSLSSLKKNLEEANLQKRKIVLLYLPTVNSNSFYGVEKIERIACQIYISVVQFKNPLTKGMLHSMEGKVLIFSTPRMEEEIIPSLRTIKVEDEIEYKDFKYQEKFAEIQNALDAFGSTSDIDYQICNGEMSNEQLLEKEWFKNLDKKQQAMALKKFSAYKLKATFEKQANEIYELVLKRLVGQCFD